VIEQFEILGMGHGVPLATGGAFGLGAEGPFMLEAGLSSTREIARFWGILQQGDTAESLLRQARHNSYGLNGEIILPGSVIAAKSPPGKERPVDQPSENFIERTIHNALKAAGLIR
jgi:hypothetical protein